MSKESSQPWEARDETEKVNALEVLYEMAIGYVLSELREEHLESYDKLISRSRYKNQLINNVRYSVDLMLNELIDEYGQSEIDDET